jgi:SpoVK/Ycf46/Vps4 family AAA+-type ATPase
MSNDDQAEISFDYTADLETETQTPQDEPTGKKPATRKPAWRRPGKTKAAEKATSKFATPLNLVVDLSLRAAQKQCGMHIPPQTAGLVIVLRVPGDSWIDPLHEFLHCKDRSMRIIAGKLKPRGWEMQETQIIEALGSGKTVCGIAADPDTQLPPLLLAAADHSVTMPMPTPGLLRKAIRLLSGHHRVPPLKPADIAGLDLLDMAAALRPHATPQACIDRLKAASASRSVATSDDTTPLLHELTGYGEAMDWCRDMVAEIEAFRAGRPAEFSSAMLYSRPGLGKTQLARSLAKTAKVPLVASSVASWFQKGEGHLGDVIKQASEVFAKARACAPCILFLDELDALPDRRTMDARARDWWTSVVTLMLTLIDACRADRHGVILIGATNHLENLDQALLRPGRFDRKIEILPPDAAGLAGILRTHLGQDCPDADLVSLARLMPGATGAMAAAIVRDARRKARRTNRPLIKADLLAEILPADPRSPAERRHVAIHEAGHAVIALRLGYGVEAVTIRGQGTTGGATSVCLPAVSDRALIDARVKILLAGRAANTLFGSAPDTGASADLAEATRLLASARVSFGLADSLVVRANPTQAADLLAYDHSLASTIETELTRLMIATKRLVAQNRAIIERVAKALLAVSTLDAQTLKELVGGREGERVAMVAVDTRPAATLPSFQQVKGEGH